MLRAPCRGGCVSGWLEERNLAHKESIGNIPSRFSFEMPPELLHMSHHFRYSPESRQVQSPAALRICVESRCGAVTLGRTYPLPPLSSGGALVVTPSLRFHIPLIEPDRRISRIRLS